MAGEWIKMRASLLTSPKVNGIARIIEDDPRVSSVLTTGFSGVMSEIVSRNVMRNVTVSSLLVIWASANEHTSDGVFQNADLHDLDDMVGIPGFGEAMESVGWAEFDEKSCSVKLPNFKEYNTCGKDRAKELNAERQRRFREKQKETSNEKNNVTKDVTNNDREEKRREDIHRVFQTWQSVMSSPESKLTKDRKTKILARLDEGYSVADLESAIRGCASSEYHMGDNPQKRKYNQIELIFRNGEKLETFKGMAEGCAAPVEAFV